MGKGLHDAATAAAALLAAFCVSGGAAAQPPEPASTAETPTPVPPYGPPYGRPYGPPSQYRYPYSYPYSYPYPPPPPPPVRREPRPLPTVAADPGDETRVDPLLPTGIVSTSVGTFLALGGALLLGSDDGVELCGVTGGCVTRPDRSRELAGGALLGSGLGLAAVGLPSLIAGVGEIPREGHRQSHGMTTAGVVLTSLAAGLVGSGLGSLVADASRGELDEKAISISLISIGGAFALGGVPLWIFGAQRPDPMPRSTPAAPMRPPSRPAEPPASPAPPLGPPTVGPLGLAGRRDG